jgi:hypothetical protein
LLVFRSLASAYEFLYPEHAKSRLSSNRKKANAAFKNAISDKANTGIVVTGESGISYVIAKHPHWKGGNSILVWLAQAVNLETRESKLYTSIQSALTDLNIKLGPIKTDPGTYCIDTGVRFYSELALGFKQSANQILTNDIHNSTNEKLILNTKLKNSLDESIGNIIFISHQTLSSIVPYLNDNTIDISYLNLTIDQLKLIKEIKKIGHRKIIYLFDAKEGVILNNGKPFESGTIAAKAIGVSGHYLLSLVDSDKFIIERYLATTNKSTFRLRYTRKN